MKWQPIETAPKDRTKILVCTYSGKVDITWWIGHGFYAGGDQYGPHTWTNFGDIALAYWMPFPPPPEKTE